MADEVPDRGRSETLMTAIMRAFRAQGATWAATSLVGVLAVFSGRLTESVRFALNRADLRTSEYQELATVISEYVFYAEQSTEFVQNNWTTKVAATTWVNDYNASFTALRRKEFVFRAWIQRFWARHQVESFDKLMLGVASFDGAVHSLNDDLEKVTILGTQSKIDPQRAQQAAGLMRPALRVLRSRSRELLQQLVP